MKRPNSAYTLIELLVASVMAMVVLSALLRVFWFARSTELTTRSSYLIRQGSDESFQRIQDDLRLTHLSSIKISDHERGFSMASPLTSGEDKSFELTNTAVAKWQTWVHYTINPTGALVGDLIRWEQPYPADTKNAIPSTSQPDQPNSSQQVLLQSVTLPGTDLIPPSSTAQYTSVGVSSDTSLSESGAQLRFLRREDGKEVFTTTNPADESDETQPGWSKGTTGLVEMRLRVADQSSESGRWSVYEIKFRVYPRN